MKNSVAKLSAVAALLLSSSAAFAGSYTNTDLLNQNFGDRVHVTVDSSKIKIDYVELTCGGFASTLDDTNLKDGDTGTFKYSGHWGQCDTDNYRDHTVYVIADIKLKYSYKGLTVWRSCGEKSAPTFTYNSYYEFDNKLTVSLDGSKKCGNVVFDLTRVKTGG